MFRLFFLHISL
ncbi:hypothetical protein SAMN02744765_0698 [Pantoea agglomerans]|nr:hypothetical protein SAMN02744765_0698 [Pantoea agglomerans]